MEEETIRENGKKVLQEQMALRMAETTFNRMEEEDVRMFAEDVEKELYELFKDVGFRYKAKFRSLLFNIKDRNNLNLWQKICERKITPYKLVRLTSKELASRELAKWRENEIKRQLELVKKRELDLLAASKTYVLKTHKGEKVMKNYSATTIDLNSDVPVEKIVSVLNKTISGETKPTQATNEYSHVKKNAESSNPFSQNLTKQKRKIMQNPDENYKYKSSKNNTNKSNTPFYTQKPEPLSLLFPERKTSNYQLQCKSNLTGVSYLPSHNFKKKRRNYLIDSSDNFKDQCIAKKYQKSKLIDVDIFSTDDEKSGSGDFRKKLEIPNVETHSKELKNNKAKSKKSKEECFSVNYQSSDCDKNSHKSSTTQSKKNLKKDLNQTKSERKKYLANRTSILNKLSKNTSKLNVKNMSSRNKTKKEEKYSNTPKSNKNNNDGLPSPEETSYSAPSAENYYSKSYTEKKELLSKILNRVNNILSKEQVIQNRFNKQDKTVKNTTKQKSQIKIINNKTVADGNKAKTQTAKSKSVSKKNTRNDLKTQVRTSQESDRKLRSWTKYNLRSSDKKKSLKKVPKKDVNYFIS